MVTIKENSTEDVRLEPNKEFLKVCIPWGSIAAGALVSISYSFLLNMLGIGLGLINFDMTSVDITKLGHGAVGWLAGSGIIAMAIGGWFVGKFSNTICKLRRGCYGVIAWSLALVFTVMTATSASGAFMGGVINLAKGPLNIVAENVIEHPVAAKIADEEYYSATGEEPQEHAKAQVKQSANSLGKDSIIIFIAFFLSGIAGILGAVYAGSFYKEKP